MTSTVNRSLSTITEWDYFSLDIIRYYCFKVCHLLSQVGADFLAHSLCHTHGCHSARLRAAHHAVAGVAVLVQVLRQLGRLAAARLPNNNYDAVVPADANGVSFLFDQELNFLLARLL